MMSSAERFSAANASTDERAKPAAKTTPKNSMLRFLGTMRILRFKAKVIAMEASLKVTVEKRAHKGAGASRRSRDRGEWTAAQSFAAVQWYR